MASWLYEEQTGGRRIGHRCALVNLAFSDCQAGPVLVDMEAGNGGNVCPIVWMRRRDAAGLLNPTQELAVSKNSGVYQPCP